METQQTEPRNRCALAGGVALGVAVCWADLAGRVSWWMTESTRGLDLPALALFFFLSAVFALLGLGLGLVWQFGLSRFLKISPGSVPAIAGAVVATQAFHWFRIGSPPLAFGVAVVVGVLLAVLFAKLVARMPKVLWFAPLIFGGLFFATDKAYIALNTREPKIDANPGAVADPDAPDLLLVTLDTTRADHLGPYGYAKARTPNLDAFAAEGVVYERAYAPNPSTQPSHASMLTGLQLPWHGIRVNGTVSLDPVAKTITEVLSGRGYETKAVLGSFALDREFGLFRGFRSYDDVIPISSSLAAVTRRFFRSALKPSFTIHVTRALNLVTFLSVSVELSRDADAVSDVAIDAIQSAPTDRPLFLWVHYWDPHGPYDPPEGWTEPFTPEADAPAEGYSYWFGTLGSIAEITARYDGEIAFMDSEIVRLFDAFKARGRKHLMAVTADHGEGLQQKGVATHGGRVYDITLHVPLILQGTDVPQDQRVSEPVAPYDLAPTFLALAGAEPFENIHGRSLLPYTSAAPACEEGRPFYHEAAKSMHMAWREGGMKLILGNEVVQLFAFMQDAAEAQDVHGQHAGVVESHTAKLDAFRRSFPEGRGVQLTNEGKIQENLAELGYVDGEE